MHKESVHSNLKHVPTDALCLNRILNAMHMCSKYLGECRVFQYLGPLRRIARQVAGHRAFHYTVTLLIVTNTIVMAMWYYGMSDSYANALQARFSNTKSPAFP